MISLTVDQLPRSVVNYAVHLCLHVPLIGERPAQLQSEPEALARTLLMAAYGDNPLNGELVRRGMQLWRSRLPVEPLPASRFVTPPSRLAELGRFPAGLVGGFAASVFFHHDDQVYNLGLRICSTGSTARTRALARRRPRKSSSPQERAKRKQQRITASWI